MGMVLMASKATGGRLRPRIFFPDMAMWGMLLWVIECAKSNGHGLDGLRGHWRPLEAERPRPRILYIYIYIYLAGKPAKQALAGEVS